MPIQFKHAMSGLKSLKIGNWNNGKMYIFQMNPQFVLITEAEIMSENTTMKNGLI